MDNLHELRDGWSVLDALGGDVPDTYQACLDELRPLGYWCTSGTYQSALQLQHQH